MADMNTSRNYISQETRPIIGATITGFMVGLIGWLVSMGLQMWIIEPIFCRSAQSFGVCSNGGTIAWGVAMVIVSIIGLFGLVRGGVFRPLLVVLAALIALWGANSWLGAFEWWQSALWQGGLFAVAYGLFAWVARLMSFILALILTIVLIIGARLVVINS